MTWERFALRNRRSIPETSSLARRGGTRWPHVLIAGVVAAWSIYSYVSSFRTNPITGELQRISMSFEQEIAMGQDAARKVIAQYGGLDPDPSQKQRVSRIGGEIVFAALGDQNPYPFEFHVLKNHQAIDAFAYPGGQVFITAGLLDQLPTDGQLAGVLAHEIAHVMLRHGAERLANARFSKGLTGALIISAYDPGDPESRKAAEVALALSHLMKMQYSREDELESDRHGVQFMAKAGYDPRALLRVIDILEAAGNGQRPDFFSTHPHPEHRRERIERSISELYPKSLPSTLKP